MPGRKYSSNSGYRYGFNGKENDNSTGEGNLDFGARIMDVRLGRWLSVDLFQIKYPALSPYNYCDNSPISFIDLDGNVIGNPNDPEVKRIKEIMLKTPTSAKVWKEMEKSSRIITFDFVHSNDENDALARTMAFKWGGANGMSLTGEAYLALVKGENRDHLSLDYTFNKNTGEYEKNSNWDVTYIVIDLDGVIRQGENFGTYVYNTTKEKAIEIETVGVVTEEGEHSVQNEADFYKNVKDKKTGKYKDMSKEKDKAKYSKDYEDRNHEKKAHVKRDKAMKELSKKQNPKK